MIGRHRSLFQVAESSLIIRHMHPNSGFKTLEVKINIQTLWLHMKPVTGSKFPLTCDLTHIQKSLISGKHQAQPSSSGSTDTFLQSKLMILIWYDLPLEPLTMVISNWCTFAHHFAIKRQSRSSILLYLTHSGVRSPIISILTRSLTRSYQLMLTCLVSKLINSRGAMHG